MKVVHLSRLTPHARPPDPEQCHPIDGLSLGIAAVVAWGGLLAVVLL